MRSGCYLIVLLAGAMLVGTTAGAAPAAPYPSGVAVQIVTAGTLALRAAIPMRSTAVLCPPGTPTSIECFERKGSAVVPGLGDVSESFAYPVESGGADCPGGYHVHGYTARLTVARKGEIVLTVEANPDCLFGPPSATVLNNTQLSTVTGGSGAYAGASGSGVLQHAAVYTSFGAAGTDTWVGTLVVPGLDFDLTAPVLRGAGAKTVRAPRGKKRVRVTYNVTAHDEVDGVVPVSCQPRSGSLLRIGRTTASCSATDTSGNTVRTRFTVTVRAAR